MKTHPNIESVTGYAVICDECDAWLEEPAPTYIEAQLQLRDGTRPDGIVRCKACETKRLNQAPTANRGTA